MILGQLAIRVEKEKKNCISVTQYTNIDSGQIKGLNVEKLSFKTFQRECKKHLQWAKDEKSDYLKIKDTINRVSINYILEEIFIM